VVLTAEGRFEFIVASDVNADALAKVGDQLVIADKQYSDRVKYYDLE
jgi:hypothetical protein